MPPEVSIEPGGSILLNPQITGTIVEYQWTPPLGLSNPAIANPLASPSITTTYFLKIKSADGCEAEGMTTVTVYKKLFMPSGFTPNGDGKNDIFRIPPGTTVKLHSFTVYDRAGQIVFTTKDINEGWDGKSGGVLLPAGIYVYQLQAEDRSGKVFAKGTVVLAR
jgi:gliding motility-associated-like protein